MVLCDRGICVDRVVRPFDVGNSFLAVFMERWSEIKRYSKKISFIKAVIQFYLITVDVVKREVKNL